MKIKKTTGIATKHSLPAALTVLFPPKRKSQLSPLLRLIVLYKLPLYYRLIAHPRSRASTSFSSTAGRCTFNASFPHQNSFQKKPGTNFCGHIHISTRRALVLFGRNGSLGMFHTPSPAFGRPISEGHIEPALEIQPPIERVTLSSIPEGDFENSGGSRTGSRQPKK